MRLRKWPFRQPFENSLSRSVHPCILLDASFCCAKTSLLHGTTAIRGGSEQPFRKPFEIDGVDTRNTVKKYRRRIFDTLRTLFYRMTQ